MSTKLICLSSLLCAGAVYADFAPIPLKPESFNQDMVVENAAPAPLIPVTTATMDTGLSNQNFTWYERGFRPEWESTGLPIAGSIITSEAVGDHQYIFAPSYTEDNAVLIDSSSLTGTFRLSNPAAYAVLSFLVSGGNGGGSVGYCLHHQDGSKQEGSFLCRDWLNGPNQAFTAAGRVNVTSFVFDMNNTNPRLYGVDIGVTNNASPIISIDFNYTSGAGREAIFAVSGSAFAGAALGPIRVSGYNADLVVEANSTRPDPLSGFTTATMDDGTANAGTTWYERGYYSPAPGTGLPPAGSEITSATATDHRFVLPASYVGNNAVLLDSLNPKATLIPQVAKKYSALSFLTAAGHGPVTNQCVVSYADGSSQTNLLVSPYWFDSAPMAVCGDGRVKVGKRLVDYINSGNPRLYAVDLNLNNAASPVTNLLMTFGAGGSATHSVFFAVSGQDASIVPPASPAVLSLTPGGNGTWILKSSAPGKVQSTLELRGRETQWTDEGTILTSFTIIRSPTQRTKFYRVVSP